MKNGLYRSNFKCFGYKRGENGIPEIVPEQAAIVKEIFDRFLDGNSFGQICTFLQNSHIKPPKGNEQWRSKTVESILKNEKYSGDLLLQKTFVCDPISKKQKKNNGECPKYLILNNHPAIIDKVRYNAAQMELARRGSKQKRSCKARTELGKYSGKYVLTDLLICDECGSHYVRKCKTQKSGERIAYWRCINRYENGVSGCDTVGIEGRKFHSAICECLNKLFTKQDETLRLLQGNLVFLQ